MAEQLLIKRMRHLEANNASASVTRQLAPAVVEQPAVERESPVMMNTLKKIQDYQVPVRATLTCPRELKICQVLADSSSNNSPFSDEYANSENRLPDGSSPTKSSQQQLGVFADTFIPENTIFGPLVSGMVGYLPDTYDRFVLRLVLADGTAICYFDLEDLEASNWMACVRSARWKEELNVEAFQHPTSYQIFYRTTSNIMPGSELRVWYTDEYAEQVHCTQPLKSITSFGHLINKSVGNGQQPTIEANNNGGGRPTTGKRGTKRTALTPSRQSSTVRANSSSVLPSATTNSISSFFPPLQQQQQHDVMINDWLASASSVAAEQPASTKRDSAGRSKRAISLIRRELFHKNHGNNGIGQQQRECATMSATSTSHTPQLEAAAAATIVNSNLMNMDDDDDVEMIANPNDKFFSLPTALHHHLSGDNPLANTSALLDALSAAAEHKPSRLLQLKNGMADNYVATAAAASANSQLTTMMMMLTKDNQSRTLPISSTNNNNNTNNSSSSNQNNINSISTNSSASTAPTTPTNFSRKKNILMSFTNATNNAQLSSSSTLPFSSSSTSFAVQQQPPVDMSPSVSSNATQQINPASSSPAVQQQQHHLMSLMMAAASVGGSNANGESTSSSSLALSAPTPSQSFHLPSSSPFSNNNTSNFASSANNNTAQRQQTGNMPVNNSVFHQQQQQIALHTHNQRQQHISALLPALMANAAAGNSSAQQQSNLMASLLALQQQQQQQIGHRSKPSEASDNAVGTAPSFFFGSNGTPDLKQPLVVAHNRTTTDDASSSILLPSTNNTRSTGSSSGGSSGTQLQPPTPLPSSATVGTASRPNVASSSSNPSSSRSNPISNSSNTDSDSPIVVDLESEEDDEVAAIDLRVQHRLAAEQQQNMLNAFQFPALAGGGAAVSHFQPASNSSVVPTSAPSSSAMGPSELAALAAAAAAFAQQHQQSSNGNNIALTAFAAYKQLLVNAAAAAASTNSSTANPAMSSALNAKSLLSYKLAAKHSQENNNTGMRSPFTQQNGFGSTSALPAMAATTGPSPHSMAMNNISQLLGLPSLNNVTPSSSSLPVVSPPATMTAPTTPSWALLPNNNTTQQPKQQHDLLNSSNHIMWLQQQQQQQQQHQQNSPLLQQQLNMLSNPVERGGGLLNSMTSLEAWRNSLVTSQQQQQLLATSSPQTNASTLSGFPHTFNGSTPQLPAANPTFVLPTTSITASMQEQALLQHQRLQKILEQQRKQKLESSASSSALHLQPTNSTLLTNGQQHYANNLSGSGGASAPVQSPSLVTTSSSNVEGTQTISDSSSSHQLLNSNASMATDTSAVQSHSNLPSSSSSSVQPPVKKREKTKKPSVPCATCGKSFSAAKDLKRHLATHTGIKPHPCIHCGKKFSRKDHVRRHVMTVHDKTYRPKKKPPKQKLLQQQQDGGSALEITANSAAFPLGPVSGGEVGEDGLNNIINAAESQDLVVGGVSPSDFGNNIDMQALREQDARNKMLELRALVDIVRPDAEELAAAAAAATSKNAEDLNVQLPLDRRSISPLQGVPTQQQLSNGFRSAATTQDFGLIWHNYTATTTTNAAT